jgi:hypothetical protein
VLRAKEKEQRDKYVKAGRGEIELVFLVVKVASERSRERSSGGAETGFYKCRQATTRRSEHALPKERSKIITGTALLSLQHHALLKTARIAARLLRRYSP